MICYYKNLNGFSKDAFTLVQLSKKIVIKNSASTSGKVAAGVPQGFVDGPLLLNIFDKRSCFIYSICHIRQLR